MAGKRVYLESYGCPSNKFDAEVMVACLEGAGHVVTGDYKSADVVVVNTCGVKSPTEAKILHRLRFLGGLGKPIVVAGCLPKIDLPAVERVVPDYLALIDPFSINEISAAVEGLERGERRLRFFSEETKVKVEMPKRRGDGVVEIMPISEGCLGACAFCCTRFARGRLFSYPVEAVVSRVRELAHDNIAELWITAQDTGAYGLDKGCDLAALLEEICDIRGEFLVRVGMMNPNNVLGMLDRLVEAYMCEMVFKFLHLPVQSGNDRVLRLMNRSYTVDDFKRIVDSFRREIPELSLSTDVICGFPGEDEGAFEDSLELVREVEPDVVNVSKFSHRPNTVAAGMKQLSSQVVKARSKKMAELCKRISLKRNRRWLKWIGEMLVDEGGEGSSMVGRNFAYRPIVVDGGHDLLGKRINVKVREVTATYLLGNLL